MAKTAFFMPPPIVRPIVRRRELEDRAGARPTDLKEVKTISAGRAGRRVNE